MAEEATKTVSGMAIFMDILNLLMVLIRVANSHIAQEKINKKYLNLPFKPCRSTILVIVVCAKSSNALRACFNAGEVDRFQEAHIAEDNNRAACMLDKWSSRAS